MSLLRFKKYVFIVLIMAVIVAASAFIIASTPEGNPGIPGLASAGPDLASNPDADPGPDADSNPDTDLDPDADSNPDADLNPDADPDPDETSDELTFTPASISPFALVTSSNLTDFVTGVVITDMTGNTVAPGSTAYIGQSYNFTITFAENPDLQLAYPNPSLPPSATNALTYQLPVSLAIQNAITQTPIQTAAGNVVGWYTINTTGVVSVWFANVDQNGNPANYNYIDLTNVTITLTITAQMGTTGGSIDFGAGTTVNINSTEPPDGISVSKTSNYNPSTETITYAVTITAVGTPGDSITGISFSDQPLINGRTIFDNPGNTAFGNFNSVVTRVSTGTTESGGQVVNWVNNSSNWMTTPANFIVGFWPTSSGLSLTVGDFVTVTYDAYLPAMIANNNSSLLSSPLNINPLDYSFIAGNQLWASSSPGATQFTSVSDPVSKAMYITKTGNLASTNDSINWTATIGDGISPALNGGALTDILGPNQTMPASSAITISLYNTPPSASLPPIYSATADNPVFNFIVNPADPSEFTFTIPQTTDTNPATASPFGNIFQIVITYTAPLTITPPTVGQPPVLFNNTITYALPGTGPGTISYTGVVPITPDTTGILTKTTSGICGRPDGTNPLGQYYIDYTITLNVPAGLFGQPLWLFDDLGLFPNGSAVTNVPQNLLITASLTGTNTPPSPAFVCTTPVLTNGNEIRIYFGTSISPYQGGTPFWQYDVPVTVTVSYRVYLPVPAVTAIQSNASWFLSNATYLVNSPFDIYIQGPQINVISGTNVNDYWPVFKSSLPTNNPALFNYTAVINGGYSVRQAPLLQAGFTPTFTDTFDPRLGYVAGSFYILDTGTPNRFFAPAPGTDVAQSRDASGNNVISVGLANLWQYSAPPALGGTPIGTGPVANWFAFKRNFEAHYQLAVINPDLGAVQTNLTNTVSIEVNPGACMFTNQSIANYTPQPITKTMTPSSPGSDLIHNQIVINPDGGIMFAPPGQATGPSQITAVDTTTNLQVYMNTISMFTETRIGGVWNGVWRAQPFTINTGALWSVNVISESEIQFVIPNSQPVMITYDALAQVGIGAPGGTIGNSINIFGNSAGFSDNSYVVQQSQVGASASSQDIMVFKQDPVHGINIRGAVFDLYVMNLTTGSPPGGLPLNLPLGNIWFTRLAQSVTTDNAGIAVFSNPWIVPSYDFLYLLVETSAPAGYPVPSPPGSYTFFTINPAINAANLSNALTSIQSDPIFTGITTIPVNNVSDFIIIEDIPNPSTPMTMRIIKSIEGLTAAEIQQSLQNLQLIVSDPLGNTFTYGLADILNPNGIVMDLSNTPAGTFTFSERNAIVQDYQLITTPQMPFSREITPNADREILLLIDNNYGKLPSLTIEKFFSPANFDPRDYPGVVSQISFLVTGIDDFGNIVYRNTLLYPQNFIGNSVTLTDLPVGTYSVTEAGGFDLSGNMMLTSRPIGAVPLRLGDDISVSVRNVYTAQLPHDGLMIRKVFHGLLPYEFPTGLMFRITDPAGNVSSHALSAGNMILLDNIQPGTYTVTETGYQIAGFDVITNPGLTVSVVVPDGQWPDIVLFDNYYTPVSPPPPPPQQPPSQPSPQTGLQTNTIFYIILIVVVLAMICGSIFMFAKRKSPKKDDSQVKEEKDK